MEEQRCASDCGDQRLRHGHRQTRCPLRVSLRHSFTTRSVFSGSGKSRTRRTTRARTGTLERQRFRSIEKKHCYALSTEGRHCSGLSNTRQHSSNCHWLGHERTLRVEPRSNCRTKSASRQHDFSFVAITRTRWIHFHLSTRTAPFARSCHCFERRVAQLRRPTPEA